MPLIQVVFFGAYLLNTVADLSYVLAIPVLAAFASYPTLPTMFSVAADKSERG